MSNTRPIAAILAGGTGRRLGGVDKAQIEIGGATLLSHVRRSLEAQADVKLLSVRSRNAWTAASGLEVVYDYPRDDVGPLGGVAAALHWANAQVSVPEFILTVPVDTPFLPDDLVARLMGETTGKEADVIVAASGGRRHHAVALWRTALETLLCRELENGPLAIHRWQDTLRTAAVEWPQTSYDPFLNVNEPKDIEDARSVLRDDLPPETGA